MPAKTQDQDVVVLDSSPLSSLPDEEVQLPVSVA